MPARRRPPSPMLAAATAAMGQESIRLVTGDSRFRHSFEAPLAAISPDPTQPRKTFDPDAIAALARTMAEQGQLQPVLLRRNPARRDHWILIAGERRWRAAQLNGWTSLLAIEHDGDAEVATLLENLQRVDLSPLEEAQGIQRLLAEKGWTQVRAAEALGRSKADMSGLLRILDLPGEVLDGLTAGRINLARNVLIELARVEPGPHREALLRLAHDGRLTVRAIRSLPEPAVSEANAGEAAADGFGSVGRFHLGGLVRVAKRLRELQAAGHVVDEIDRRRLLTLRRDIDALLELAAHESTHAK